MTHIELDKVSPEGLRYVVLASTMGHRCGYVAVPPTHPLHGVNYGEAHPALVLADVASQPIGGRGIIPLMCCDWKQPSASPEVYFDVHGSLTYSGDDRTYPAPADGPIWWFGFDCAHAGDAADPELMDEEHAEFHQKHPSEGVLRTMDYVEAECLKLAAQLAAVGERTIT